MTRQKRKLFFFVLLSLVAANIFDEISDFSPDFVLIGFRLVPQ
jgi:hypothetical protein